MKRSFEYIDQHFDEMLEELKWLCSQPSVSAQHLGIEETAKMVEQTLKKIGATTKVLDNPNGNPVIYGELKGESDKTILMYDHYDVQPPEPLDKWIYPPFGCEIHDDKFYACGSSDNKGTFLARVQAIEAIQKTGHKLPVNVKFLVEGEEEIGSPSLQAVVDANRDLLKADVCLWENSQKDEDDSPVVKLGSKGMLYVELSVVTGEVDVHSGNAPIIPNAAWRLVKALDSLKDDKENVLIEGFYDDVLPICPEEKEAWTKIPSPEFKLKKRLGIDQFLNNATGDEINVALYTKPTCNICGISGGYTGKGQKAVIPCTASCKLDFRLVVAQNPHHIVELLRAHLDKHGFQDVQITIVSTAAPSKTMVTEPFVKVIQNAAADVYDKPIVVLPTAAGTGPREVFEYSHMPIAGLGCGYAAENHHAPNENIRLEDYKESAKHIVALLFHAANEPIV